MAIVLSCVAMVATVGKSASAKIASAGVVLTCPVIVLPPYLWHISRLSIIESETHGSHTAAAYLTFDLHMVMYVDC